MMRLKQSCLRAGPLLLLAAALASPVLGQQVLATLTGTVTDSTGAVRTDATVTAKSVETGIEYPTKTNDAGVYTITGLPIGHYTVEAKAPTFKTLSTNAVELETGQVAKVNIKLEVGVQTDTVEVVGVSTVLQTENATVGDVISGTTVQAMPLNGRNFSQLTLLLPGVQTHVPDTFTDPKQDQNSGRPYVNGQREQSNNYMIDGVDMNEAVDNLVAYYPSPDAIAEMKVETNNYSAEFGNTAGGVISVVIKSGSNDFHGSAYDYGRNDSLDANSWLNDKSQTGKANLKQNIFGATFSGPISKNKVFFFADYQGWVSNAPGSATASVAPGSWRTGDLSSVATPIINPNTGLPFPGNIIPQSMISPIASAFLNNTANYPLPNRPGIIGNYAGNQDNSVHNHQGDAKIDANLTQNDNVFVRASIGHYDSGTSELIFPTAGGGQTASSDLDNFSANWTHVFGPTSVNEFRLGLNHNTFVLTSGDPGGIGNYNAALGIPGGQVVPGMSQFDFSGSGLSLVGNIDSGHNSDNTVYQASDKLSFSLGRHFVSVGGAFLHYSMNQLYLTNSGALGDYLFNGSATGFAFADFLLGRVAEKSIGEEDGGTPLQAWTQLQNRVGVFVQDDYKPTSNLTVNLGLRWEYSSALTEENNRQENFDVNNGGAVIPATASNPTAGVQNYYGGFSPRVGFAWTVDPKTVVRGGFGMVRYMEGTGANCRLTINPAFGTDSVITYANSTGSLATGMTDVLPNTQARAWQTNILPQLTKQWNFFVERELGASTSLSLGYVGSRSSDVVAFDNLNQPFDNANGGPGSGPVPFPQFSFVRYTSSQGVEAYDGLQASVRHRKSHGLEFQASYTFSKSLGDNQGFYGPGWGGTNTGIEESTMGWYGDGNLDVYNRMLDYGRLWFAAKHTGAFSATYDLPIGKGRAVGGDWNGVTQALLGGWNVSGILTVRSGLPITVTNGWNLPFMETRPNIVGPAVATNPSWNDWLNISSFQNPAAGTYGNSGVGIADGPGYWDVDFGLDKAFALGGSKTLTVRIEAFNVFNHPNMGMPNRDTSDPSTFGQILSTASAARVVEIAGKFAF